MKNFQDPHATQPATRSAGPVRRFNGWDVGYVPYRAFESGQAVSWIREWGDQVDNWADQQRRVRVARVWGETPMLTQASAHLSSLNRIYKPETKPAGADLWAGIDAFRGYHHQPFLGAPDRPFSFAQVRLLHVPKPASAGAQPRTSAAGPWSLLPTLQPFIRRWPLPSSAIASRCDLRKTARLLPRSSPTAASISRIRHSLSRWATSVPHAAMLFANNAAPGALDPNWRTPSRRADWRQSCSHPPPSLSGGARNHSVAS